MIWLGDPVGACCDKTTGYSANTDVKAQIKDNEDAFRVIENPVKISGGVSRISWFRTKKVKIYGKLK